MKKESQVSKVAKLFKANPNMSASDMAKETGLPIKRIYVLRSLIGKKLKGSRPTTKTPTPMPLRGDKLSTLEAENKKLTEWTLLWKQKYEKLERDYTQAKIMFLNSEAVVTYLEGKIAQLMKEHDNG
jgi:hypothetical protein